jgi:hypothetical protein
MPYFPPFTTLLESPLSSSTTGDICPESSSLEQQSSNAHVSLRLSLQILLHPRLQLIPPHLLFADPLA